MSLGRAMLSEAVGTGILVLFGAGAIMVDAWSGGRLGTPGIAVAFGLAVIIGAMSADSSGGHINPAVTLALWSAGRFSGRRVGPYIVAQCAGASVAALALRLLLGDVAHVGATIPAIAPLAAALVELVMSAVLLLAVLASAAGGVVPPPVAAGLAVALCALVGGPLTGASMNPARSLGPAIAGNVWQHHWLYWLAPIAGMLVAVQLHRSSYPAEQG